MRRLIWLLNLALLLQGADPSARELFERAHLLAEQNRNLPEAIELFGQAAQRAGKQQDVAAQATLQQGLLYERLGKQAEAERAFNAVVRNFPTQSDAVRRARAKLPKPVPEAQMRTRRVWSGDGVDSFGAPSPDGRFLSFVDWTTGDLAVRDLDTGETRRLTHKSQSGQESATAMWSVFSPDGSRVAYSWYDSGHMEARIVDLKGSDPVMLYSTEVRHELRVSDWSPDGQYLLAEMSNKLPNSKLSLLLIRVADGSVRELASPNCLCATRMVFSEDSRFVGYEAQGPGEENRDIYLSAVEGSRVEKVVRNAESDDALLGFASGGRLVFASDRSGSVGIWTQTVKDGKALGTPQLIRRDVRLGEPLGITRNGALFYATSAGSGQTEVYVAGINVAAKSIAEAPSIASPRYLGAKATPAWSPDGKRLAYLAGPSRVLVILTLDTGEEREVTQRLVESVRILSWHADGRSVIMQGTGSNNQSGTYRVDVESGIATLLLSVNDRPVFSLDMTTAYFGNGSVVNPGIYSRDLKTGQETTLYKPSDRAQTRNLGTAISPDGKLLAVRLENLPPGSSSLAVLSAQGGDLRIIAPDTQVRGGMNLQWTPDSANVLFTRAAGQNSELWMAPADGGALARLGGEFIGAPVIRLSPDGTRLAYTVDKSGEEIWVMENFLNP